MGRPAWKPTDEQRAQVEALSSYGIPQEEIAKFLGVSMPTLRKHCCDELDNASIRANAKVAETLFDQATSGKSIAATLFWLKTRAGWRETDRLEIIHEMSAAVKDAIARTAEARGLTPEKVSEVEAQAEAIVKAMGTRR